MDEGRIYIRSGGSGNVEPLEEAPFKLEEELQGLIADYPALLDGRQITSHEPRRWLLVTREQGIADISDAGARWAVDHLLVDQDAVPTLVEVKRGSSSDMPRKVVGQMLEYAAHAVRTWKADDLRRAFEQTCEKAGKERPIERLDDFLEGNIRPEDESDSNRQLRHDRFWDEVARNLAAKKLRLLFVADAIPVELERVVEFLNEQMDDVEVLAVEVKRFQNQSNETFVPRVMGQHAKPRRPGSGSRRVVTKEEFLDACDESGKRVFSKILDLAETDSKRISWGDKGFSLGVYIASTRVVFCAGYPPDARGDKQHFRTWLYDSRGGVENKTENCDIVIENLRKQFEEAVQSPEPVGKGKDLKFPITPGISNKQENALVEWCKSAERTIKKLKLKV